MEELIKQLNVLLESFNNSFALKANFSEQDGEQIVKQLNISELKNDGSEFVTIIVDMLTTILSTSDEYELVFDEKEGLNIAKKVQSIKYVKEK